MIGESRVDLKLEYISAELIIFMEVFFLSIALFIRAIRLKFKIHE